MADPINISDQLASSPQPLTIQYARRSVVMLTVSKDELMSVSGLGGSIYLAFFGTCLGALISFAIVLSSATIANPYTFAAYIALTGVSAIGALFFGIRSIQEYRDCRKRLRQLTQDQA